MCQPAPDVGGQHEDVGDGEHVAAVEEEDDLPSGELVQGDHGGLALTLDSGPMYSNLRLQ